MPIGIYKRTEKARQNIGKAKLGQIPWNKGMKDVYKTIPCSEAKKEAISNSLNGHITSETTKEKIRKGNIGKQCGEKNKKWKGDKVGYFALHTWLGREYGVPNKCENIHCVYPRKRKRWDEEIMYSPKRFEWANIDGIYEREKKHWKMLCPSCHRILDNNNGKQLMEFLK